MVVNNVPTVYSFASRVNASYPVQQLWMDAELRSFMRAETKQTIAAASFNPVCEPFCFLYLRILIGSHRSLD